MVFDPKTKKKRTIEVDTENQTVELSRFWEDPLVLEHGTPTKDMNIVPDEYQITLRDINEPTLLEHSDEAQMVSNFAISFEVVLTLQMCVFLASKQFW